MNPDGLGAQLNKILSSSQFAHAERLSRFLRLVVEEAEAGNAESLKEYRIGVDVFDRGKDFNPRVDPIVRIQAARLRSKLLEYYAEEGVNDPIVISIPKGGYVPQISSPKLGDPVVTQPSADRSRIAVLPFVNLSADAENEYFSDGLTEELINRLARIPSLQVVARTSAFRFKGRNEDIREVGIQLSAGTIVEGSVRRSGDQIRMTAQLIDVQSGYHLFSRTYQRQYTGLFELQDELAQAVINEIVPLNRGEFRLGTAAQATIAEAYNLYLRGMFASANRYEDLPSCIDLFRQALTLDPSYAPAWAGLAHTYWLLAWYRAMPPAQALPLSKEAALRTLELDGASAQGHSSLGLVECGLEWRWQSAETHFKKAIELQPSLAIIYPFYAVACLMPQLRMDEACAMAERSLTLDPFNPLFHAIATFVYGNAGRFEQALRQNARGMEVNPYFPPIIASGAVVREWQGNLDQAIADYRKACELSGNRPTLLSYLGHALAKSGEKAEAEEILQKLLELPDPPDLDIARIYVGLHYTEEALRWLEVAAQRRNIHLLMVPSDLHFDSVRTHPRFNSVLRQMGLGKPDGLSH